MTTECQKKGKWWINFCRKRFLVYLLKMIKLKWLKFPFYTSLIANSKWSKSSHAALHEHNKLFWLFLRKQCLTLINTRRKEPGSAENYGLFSRLDFEVLSQMLEWVKFCPLSHLELFTKNGAVILRCYRSQIWLTESSIYVQAPPQKL